MKSRHTSVLGRLDLTVLAALTLVVTAQPLWPRHEEPLRSIRFESTGVECYGFSAQAKQSLQTSAILRILDGPNADIVVEIRHCRVRRPPGARRTKVLSVDAVLWADDVCHATTFDLAYPIEEAVLRTAIENAAERTLRVVDSVRNAGTSNGADGGRSPKRFFLQGTGGDGACSWAADLLRSAIELQPEWVAVTDASKADVLVEIEHCAAEVEATVSWLGRSSGFRISARPAQWEEVRTRIAEILQTILARMDCRRR